MLQQINQLQSELIRSMALHFYEQHIPVTFFGKAWGNSTNNWIYFDTVLDIEDLKNSFNLTESIELHENLDPKSGQERGFIDTQTGEAIMGKI